MEQWLLTLLYLGRRRLRTSAADGSTEANLYLLPTGRKCRQFPFATQKPGSKSFLVFPLSKDQLSFTSKTTLPM